MLAALVPAAECPARADGNPPAEKTLTTTVAGVGHTPTPSPSGPSGRTVIPPPRAFRPGELEGLATRAAARKSVTIPPPRIFVPDRPAATPLTTATAAAPTPQPEVVPDLATAPTVEPATAEPPTVEPATAEPATAEPATADAPAGLNAALLSLGVAPKESNQPESKPEPESKLEPEPVAAVTKDEPTQPAPQVEPSREAPAAEPTAAIVAEPVTEPPTASELAPQAPTAPELVTQPESPAPVVEPAAQPAPKVEESAPAAAPEPPAPVVEPAAQPAPKVEESAPAPAPRAVPPTAPAAPDGKGTTVDKLADVVASESPATAKQKTDDEVDRATCTTCGTRHVSSDGHVFTGCANGNCIPGRPPCNLPANECNTVIGAFMQNLYQEICCPDPCYQPRWEPAAFASLFADYARPRTVTRIRVDRGIDMTSPDRNLYFLSQTGAAKTINNRRTGQSYQLYGASRLSWTQMYLYQEAAGEKGSFFVEYPYRQINPSGYPTQAGFGDVNFGMKSLLFDQEMLQVAYQFRTYMPSGNSNNGLGTGHISLEPSILASLKLGPETFYQAQVAQWIPIGGNSQMRGGVLSWLMSLNQVLFYTTPDSPVIGTLEMDGWSFQDGGYTSPWIAPIASGGTARQKRVLPSGGSSFFNIGPGLRWSICNKMDLGGALTWSTTPGTWASPWFRFEVRFLF